ncbi:MAG TPA: hypothetical protein VLI04_14025 [Nocardioidaceae bacterium]|nr:hypothetical protein [Nocardioidaceae bacterium]
MTSTTPVGSCRNCGTPYGPASTVCPGCGLSVASVMAERVPATAVYGAPPAAPVVLEPDPNYTPQFAAPPLVTPPDPRRTRNIVVGGVLALVLILGAVWGWSYLRDRPVRSTLDDAASAYARLLEGLASAESLDDIRAAAEEAGDVADVLARAEMELAGHNGDLADAALVLVRGEHDLATAATRLNALTQDELGVWGAAESSLAQAREDVAAAKAALAEVDADEAGAVDDPAKAIDNVRSVVGDAATRVLTRSVIGLVDQLGVAERTAQVRRLAVEARNESAVVTAALVGLSGDSADTVEVIGAVFDQLAKLEALDAGHLGVWADERVATVAALAEVVEADGAPKAFGTAVTRAVDNVDRLVSSGRAAIKQWRAELERAKRKQARAKRTLTAYTTAVSEQLTAYQTLRSELADFFQQVEDGSTEVDARAVLQAAYDGRRGVLVALKAVEAPGSLLDVHAELERVVQRATRVVKAAYDGLDEAFYCDGCIYTESESYQTFSLASAAVGAEFAAAERGWQQTVTEVEESISDKALPKKPVV